jgi:hypothetical protein
MGDAPRRPDANRHGRMGMACRGTACRAPTMLGDPAGRPDDGQPDAMGDTRDVQRTRWATHRVARTRTGTV